MSTKSSQPVIEVTNLTGGYGSVQILYGVDLIVNEGEFVTIIGPNGCGKSTFLKVLFGLATHYDGEVRYRGTDIAGWRTDRLVSHGIGYVPQVDNVFPSLTIRENLQMGGLHQRPVVMRRNIEHALGMFPDLAERINDLAATLSGGERQMLAISRALISEPKFLLLDELTAALSPIYQQRIIASIDDLRDEGISVLLVEQNARLSLSRSDRGYIFSSGKMVHTGPASEMLNDPEIGKHFLGINGNDN